MLIPRLALANNWTDLQPSPPIPHPRAVKSFFLATTLKSGVGAQSATAAAKSISKNPATPSDSTKVQLSRLSLAVGFEVLEVQRAIRASNRVTHDKAPSNRATPRPS